MIGTHPPRLLSGENMWLLSFSHLWLLPIGLLAAVYCYIRKQHSFWAERGVPFIRAHWLFGNFGDNLVGKKSLPELLSGLYTQFKNERFGGIWRFFTPVLCIVDPVLIRDILVKDFDKWPTRGLHVNEEADPLNRNLTNMQGKRWKFMRSTMTPTFSSGKLKEMHCRLVESGRALEQYLHTVMINGGIVEAGEMCARFTIDTVGSCCFGIGVNTLRDENLVFLDAWRRIFIQTRRDRMMRILQTDFVLLFKRLSLGVFTRKLADFFVKITRENFEYREENNVKRHDFIDLLKNVRNTRKSLGEDEIEFDDKLLAAQAFVFFAAGSGLSAIAISFCLHELAHNQDIQNRLREEVHETKAASNGEITWDGVKRIKYLNMVFQETHRKYPPVLTLVRSAVKPYRIPGTKVDLPSGTECMIPIYAIHQDPVYYPDPEKFDPERFNDEAKNQRPAFTFLPFGDGPRTCIGLRFAEQQFKIALVKLVDKFKISPSEKSKDPLQFDPSERFLAAKGGIWIRISKNLST